jgi:WD40 repeat protein
VKLWNVENGNLIHTFVGHNEGIYDVCFSSDGQTIATASLDKSVKLWSVDGNLLKTLTGHDNAVYGVSFSPNGQIVASASWDGSIKLWSAETLDFDNLLEHGRDWLRDYVTHNPNVCESDRRLILDDEF